MTSIMSALVWKYGKDLDIHTKQVNPKEQSPNPKMYIAKWEHPSIPKPDDIQIQAIVIEYEAYLQTIAYIKLRRKEYPSTEDQLDAIFKGGQDFKDMQDSIIAIKEKYPKP